jgi:hypothetical protein
MCTILSGPIKIRKNILSLVCATSEGTQGLKWKFDCYIASILHVCGNYWSALHSSTLFPGNMNWLWTYVGLRASGFEGNNPAPVWHRTPVLNIIWTYLKDLTTFHIYKKRAYIRKNCEETFSRDVIAL